MFNRTTDAKAFATAACALAIALFTIGMGVNSSWAGSDQPSGLLLPPISSEAVSLPPSAAGHPHRSITLQLRSVTHRVILSGFPLSSATSASAPACPSTPTILPAAACPPFRFLAQLEDQSSTSVTARRSRCIAAIQTAAIACMCAVGVCLAAGQPFFAAALTGACKLNYDQGMALCNEIR